MTIAAVFLLSTFLSASIHNYPGGAALERLIDHNLPSQLYGMQERVGDAVASGKFSSLKNIIKPVFVHIDVLAATSGVTRHVDYSSQCYVC